MKQKIDRKWSEYPIGTKAYSVLGGYWIKNPKGWTWFNGSTFPTPGADAISVELPVEQIQGPNRIS